MREDDSALTARLWRMWIRDRAALRAGETPDTSPAPDVAASAEPPAPPVAAGEGDVFRAASAGEAHHIDAEWDDEAQAWHHRCVRCGADSIGDMPLLPCDPDTGGPA